MITRKHYETPEADALPVVLETTFLASRGTNTPAADDYDVNELGELELP